MVTGRPRGRPRKNPISEIVGDPRHWLDTPVDTHLKTDEEARTELASANDWRAYFADAINAAEFVPYDLQFDLQSEEMRAHLSREAYIEYYGRGGAEFWTRVSMKLKPQMIVELGTAFGLRTNMIGKLNPGAKFVSADIQYPYPLNNIAVQTGYIARMNHVPFDFHWGNTWDTFIPQPFNLCFIDADHSEEGVRKDTEWAWRNCDINRYCIAWDDYPLPGVKAAVDAFCKQQGHILYSGCGMVYIGNEDWLK